MNVPSCLILVCNFTIFNALYSWIWNKMEIMHLVHIKPHIPNLLAISILHKLSSSHVSYYLHSDSETTEWISKSAMDTKHSSIFMHFVTLRYLSIACTELNKAYSWAFIILTQLSYIDILTYTDSSSIMVGVN